MEGKVLYNNKNCSALHVYLQEQQLISMLRGECTSLRGDLHRYDSHVSPLFAACRVHFPLVVTKIGCDCHVLTGSVALEVHPS